MPSWVHAVGASFDDSNNIEHDIQPSVKILIMYDGRLLSINDTDEQECL